MRGARREQQLALNAVRQRTAPPTGQRLPRSWRTAWGADGRRRPGGDAEDATRPRATGGQGGSPGAGPLPPSGGARGSPGPRPLGHDDLPELVAERHGGRDDAPCRPVLLQVREEAAVELHLVHRDRPELCQRRVPGAEVVQRNVDPGLAQLGQRCSDWPRSLMSELSVISSSSAYGASAVLRQGRQHRLVQALLRERARGEVDGDAQWRARVAPSPSLTQRVVEDRASHLADQAGLLRDRDELVRGDEAEVRMTPPCECFGPDDDEVLGAAERLEDRVEVPVRQRRPAGLRRAAGDGSGPPRTRLARSRSGCRHWPLGPAPPGRCRAGGRTLPSPWRRRRSPPARGARDEFPDIDAAADARVSASGVGLSGGGPRGTRHRRRAR